MLLSKQPILSILFALVCAASVASAVDPISDDAIDQRPLVQMNVSMEVAAIERSVDEISRSIGEIADSMEKIATAGELTPTQLQHLESIMGNLDQVVAASSTSMDSLPAAVERSREALRIHAAELLADIKFWFFVVAGVVAVLLVVALAAFYWFTLRPLQRTVLQAVRQISEMAQALANTSKSLEIINETHREVLRLSGFEERQPLTGPEDDAPG